MRALVLSDLIVGNYYIYLITNLINGKFYVGKTNNLKIRWRNHKKIAFGGKQKYPKDFSIIHSAIAKYGADNFNIEIIEQFVDEKECYLFETWWIDYLGSNGNFGYNCNAGGEGGISPTEITRQKLIDAQNSPKKQKILSELMTQRHLDDPGFLGKINAGNKYRVGKTHSIESKNKMSESRKANDQRGENVSNSKLTNEKVLEIRERYKNEKIYQYELAIIYGVSQSVICDIVTRKAWAHI